MGKITTYYKGDMLFQSKVGNHILTIDVPPAMDGKDRGPTPPEVFIASLGSCVGAFVANYCEPKGVSTQDMTVDVTFEKVSNPTRLADLQIQVNLPHAECNGREKAILRVAEHCPVHETIGSLEGIGITINGKNGKNGHG
jgi:putative redox protein